MTTKQLREGDRVHALTDRTDRTGTINRINPVTGNYWLHVDGLDYEIGPFAAKELTKVN